MKLLLNRITERDKELIEALGTTKGDVTYSVDTDGNEVMVLSEEVESKLMQELVGRMVDKDLSTKEEARIYLESEV